MREGRCGRAGGGGRRGRERLVVRAVSSSTTRRAKGREEDAPPAVPHPASNVNPTTPSLTRIGNFSLPRTSSPIASLTSLLTSRSRPSATCAVSASSSCDVAQDGSEKSVRARLTRTRVPSARRRSSSVREMRARRESRGVMEEEPSEEGGGRPRTASAFEAADSTSAPAQGEGKEDMATHCCW